MRRSKTQVYCPGTLFQIGVHGIGLLSVGQVGVSSYREVEEAASDELVLCQPLIGVVDERHLLEPTQPAQAHRAWERGEREGRSGGEGVEVA